MVDFHDGDMFSNPSDFEKGWRMIILVVRNPLSPGGLHIRTDMVKGDMDFAKEVVNRILPEYGGWVIGWKITFVLNCQ